MPTTPKTLIIPSDYEYAAALHDQSGHSLVVLGDDRDEVWESLADAENFDIPTTVATIYRNEDFVWDWREEEQYFGDTDDCLINLLTKNNFDPKDVL